MTGYTDEENNKFNKLSQNIILYKKAKKAKKPKRKRGLKRGEWKGGGIT